MRRESDLRKTTTWRRKGTRWSCSRIKPAAGHADRWMGEDGGITSAETSEESDRTLLTQEIQEILSSKKNKPQTNKMK